MPPYNSPSPFSTPHSHVRGDWPAGSMLEPARTDLTEASRLQRSVRDEMLHPDAPGVGEAVLLWQHSQLNPASLYPTPCLLSGFGPCPLCGFRPYPLWVAGCLTFPAAPAGLDSQPESSWNRCEEVGVVAAVQEVAPAVCKVWQVGSMAGEARTGHPAPSSFPGQS